MISRAGGAPRRVRPAQQAGGERLVVLDDVDDLGEVGRSSATSAARRVTLVGSGSKQAGRLGERVEVDHSLRDRHTGPPASRAQPGAERGHEPGLAEVVRHHDRDRRPRERADEPVPGDHRVGAPRTAPRRRPRRRCPSRARWRAWPRSPRCTRATGDRSSAAVRPGDAPPGSAARAARRPRAPRPPTTASAAAAGRRSRNRRRSRRARRGTRRGRARRGPAAT